MNCCETCQIVQGNNIGIHSKQYLVELEGEWVLNHYGGSINNYLGYLVLATKKHRTDISNLSANELGTLGLNLKWINSNLREYWTSHFPNDPIEQIYFAYYNETPYIHKLTEQELLDNLHVHFHILPRTKKMFEVCDGKKLAWDLLKIVKYFPPYLINNESDKEDLMKYLKKLSLTFEASQ